LIMAEQYVLLEDHNVINVYYQIFALPHKFNLSSFFYYIYLRINIYIDSSIHKACIIQII